MIQLNVGPDVCIIQVKSIHPFFYST